MTHRFKEGDLVQTNYNGRMGSHASNWPNGVVFKLVEKYSFDGVPGWWDPSHTYYWLEDWLLPASGVDRPVSRFGKFIRRIENETS